MLANHSRSSSFPIRWSRLSFRISMSLRRTSFAWLSLFVLFVSSSGCKPASTGGGGGSAAGNVIVIGHYASLTGPEATFGQSTDNGVRLAVDEFNTAGGFKGKQIKLLTYDDKSDAREVGQAVTRLVTDDKVTAVIGEVASSLSLVAAPICQENSVPMISPSSTNTKVTEVGDMISRVCFIDPFQAYVCAKFAREHERVKASKAAILFAQDQTYSVQLREEFEKWFTQFGGTITTVQTHIKGDQDFSAQLTAIRATNPDVIFVPGYYTDVGNIAVQARKLNITVPLLGGDGWDSDKLAEIAGKSIEGCFYSNHYSPEDPSPRVQEFLKKYKDRFGGTPDGLAALGYDAARILFEAMGRSLDLTGENLAKAIAETKDFQGVTGVITIDAKRDAVKPAVILEMKDGQRKYVTTIEPPR
jgi:branched-chain amino acid transport system substrate-binding protein